MALMHLSSGDVANLAPFGDKVETAATAALFKDAHLEVMRIVLSAGKQLPAHAVDGPITVQCIEGEVEFRNGSLQRTLHAGDLLYLAGGEPHELRALKSSSLLVTIVLLNAPDEDGSASERRKRHDGSLKTSS